MKNNALRTPLFSALQNRTNSVLAPSAQFVKLCSGLSASISAKLGLDNQVESSLSQDYRLLLIIALQLQYSLRISEVLGIALKDIDKGGRCYVTTRKRSRPIVVSDLQITALLSLLKEQGAEPFIGLTRYYIYRQYLALGVVYFIPGNKNRSVTHAFRHMNADRTRHSGFEDKFVTAQLNHKSQNTQQHYGHTRKKSSEQ